MHVEEEPSVTCWWWESPGYPVLSLLSPRPLNSEHSPHPAKKVNEFGDKYLKCG